MGVFVSLKKQTLFLFLKVEEMAGVREITAGEFLKVCVLHCRCLVTKNS